MYSYHFMLQLFPIFIHSINNLIFGAYTVLLKYYHNLKSIFSFLRFALRLIFYCLCRSGICCFVILWTLLVCFCKAFVMCDHLEFVARIFFWLNNEQNDRISIWIYYTDYNTTNIGETVVAWSYGSWIYNYICNQCLSPLMLWVRISVRARYTTWCYKVCQWLATGRWFSPAPPVSSTNETGVKQH